MRRHAAKVVLAIGASLALLLPATVYSEELMTASGTETTATEQILAQAQNQDVHQHLELMETDEAPAADLEARTPNTQKASNPEVVQPVQHALGWEHDSNGWRYWTEANAFKKSEWLHLNGEWYWFGSDGYAVTGLQEIWGTPYYFDSSCKMKTGLIKAEGTSYFADQSGALKSGWIWTNNAWYYFKPSDYSMATGVVRDGSSSYYLRENGTMTTGWNWDAAAQCWRYANKSGVLLSGWHWIDYAWYYIEPATYAMKTGVISEQGKSYYLAPNGKMGTNWIYKASTKQWLFADYSGVLKKGWQYIDKCWYHFNNDFIMEVGLITDAGSKYLLKDNGKMVVGWDFNQMDQNWYYADKSGRLKSGWLYDGEWYYLDPSSCAMYKGTWLNESGACYHFNYSGVMQHDCWVEDSEGLHYLANSGKAITGWKDSDRGKFYFDSNDADHHYPALTGFQTIEGKEYFFDAKTGAVKNDWVKLSDGSYGFASKSGALSEERIRDGILWLNAEKKASGLTKIGDQTFYADPETGSLLSGWISTKGKTYYFSPTTKTMQKGWLYDNGWYYLDKSSGAMAKGWVYDGSWYYLSDTGLMQTGWLDVDGQRYYLNPSNGAMQKGWLYDNGWYYFDKSSGAMQKGWVLDGSWYYLASNGLMQKGWVKLGGQWYYLHPSSGAMQTGVIVDNGTYYLLAKDGHWINTPIRWGDMLQRAQQYGSRTSWLLLVDTSSCRTGIYNRVSGVWAPYYEWDCSLGAPDTPTPKGEYTVYGKGYSFGHGYTCYYYTQFYGDYLFHSVPCYEGTFNVRDGRMGMYLSLGCVRLPIDQAKWMYDNIPYGTKVIIY